MQVNSRLKIICWFLAACFFQNQAHATESAVPPTMPSGATMGVPIGASPPPGLYFGVLNALFNGSVYFNGQQIPVKKTVAVSVGQFQWVPGYTVLGGSYKAMLTIPFIYAHQKAYGESSEQVGLGDITIAPANLSWMIAPGIFMSGGLSFTLPTGSFSTERSYVSTGTNRFATVINTGFSYLRDGWNLSADFNYFFYTKNDNTNYRSGDEFLMNWTAMKDFGAFSFGPVGYWRKQVADDINYGTYYGGVSNGRAEQVGLGFGLSKKFGNVTATLNYTHDVKKENTLSGGTVFLNFVTPIKF
ncbi:transporter [Rhizobium sp.]|jgi:hypothetical protein|uniref:SphA family protein n=1 Tax=Rhizobium sp. TaxID=391 RepID=UPI000E9B940F|nr:hypothetical protein [Rhizobium sp.]